MNSAGSTVPNHGDEHVIDPHSQDYRFRPAHRIMVQVQSTWFPLIDRNPQTFVPSICAARDSGFRMATHRISRSPQRASHADVSVREGATP